MPYGPNIRGYPLSFMGQGQGVDGEQDALAELLASLEQAQAPSMPRTSGFQSALGGIGDSLIAVSRVLSGGQAPDYGPYAAERAGQRQAFEQRSAEVADENRNFRNTSRVKAFEARQKREEREQENTAKRTAKQEELDAKGEAYRNAAELVAAQVPSLMEQANALKDDLLNSPNEEDQLVARNIIGASQALGSIQDAVIRLGESGSFNQEAVKRYEAAADHLRDTVTTAVTARAAAERAERNAVAADQRARETALATEGRRAEGERASDERQAIALQAAVDLQNQRNQQLLERQAIQAKRIEGQRTKNKIASSKISETAALIGTVDQLAGFLAKSPTVGGPVFGRLPAVTGERTSGFAQIQNIGSLLLKARSGGAVTDAEYERLSPFIPLATDFGDNRKVKLRLLRQELNRVAAARGAEVGISPEEFNAILQSGRTGMLEIEQILNERDEVGENAPVELPPNLVPIGNAEF